jgi:hypothetical protein
MIPSTLKLFLLALCALSLSAASSVCPDAGVYLWPDGYPAPVTQADCGETIVTLSPVTYVMSPQFVPAIWPASIYSIDWTGKTLQPLSQSPQFWVVFYNGGPATQTIQLTSGFGTLGATFLYAPPGYVVTTAAGQALNLPPYTSVKLWALGFDGWLAVIGAR